MLIQPCSRSPACHARCVSLADWVLIQRGNASDKWNTCCVSITDWVLMQVPHDEWKLFDVVFPLRIECWYSPVYGQTHTTWLCFPDGLNADTKRQPTRWWSNSCVSLTDWMLIQRLSSMLTLPYSCVSTMDWVLIQHRWVGHKQSLRCVSLMDWVLIQPCTSMASRAMCCVSLTDWVLIQQWSVLNAGTSSCVSLYGLSADTASMASSSWQWELRFPTDWMLI